MGEFSPWHWLLVIAIALLLFAPTRFASLGKSLAEGIRSFKEGMRGDPPGTAPPPTTPAPPVATTEKK